MQVSKSGEASKDEVKGKGSKVNHFKSILYKGMTE